jgi:hypothetical protein
LVWSSILEITDRYGEQSDFVSSSDSDLALFHKHPWSIGGGGASDLKESLEANSKTTLDNNVHSIGFAGFSGTVDLFFQPLEMFKRIGISSSVTRRLVAGDSVRDWRLEPSLGCLAPYDRNFNAVQLEPEESWGRFAWHCRSILQNVISFGGRTRKENGDWWWTWYRWQSNKYQHGPGLVYVDIATHMNVACEQSIYAFDSTAPVIKLPRDASENLRFGLLGLLNSSTICFWLKQSCHNKGSTVDQQGARQRTSPFEDFYAFNATKMKFAPVPEHFPDEIAVRIDALAKSFEETRPSNVCSCSVPTADLIAQSRQQFYDLRKTMIALQEELDWFCYNLYSLIDLDFHSHFNVPGLELGQRAFEIVLARKIAVGDAQSTWFERHGSTPITELPAEWPEDYKKLVERRIELIENDPNIRLIEQPEYKRRWNTESWESQLERALREWLLLRLETYFDFDGRMSLVTSHSSLANDKGQKTNDTPELSAFAPLREISVYPVAQLADAARRDPQFMEVGELYRNDPAFDVQALVEELVLAESVPHLPILRYKDSGLRKRAEWEKTWELQREEDRHLSLVTGHASLANDKGQMTNDKPFTIPVPPKYTSADFISTGGARYWSLRGKLDVPKERWISFPHCEGPDGTLVICWAGYDHLQQAQAISAYYVRVQTEFGGSDDPRLIPLLASLIELLPWLAQWHNEPNANFDGLRMGDYFEGFVNEEARNLGKTLAEIKAWVPVKKVAKTKSPKSKKKSAQVEVEAEE